MESLESEMSNMGYNISITKTDFQKIPKESFDLLIIEIRIGLGPNGNLDQGSYSATNDKETG